MAKQSNESNSESEFLLAEYNTIKDLRTNLDNLGESRLNFFFTLLSASLVGLGLLNQIENLKNIMYFLNSAILFSLILFGLATFSRMVERTVKLMKYDFALNRIRTYFAEKNPSIADYLFLLSKKEKLSFNIQIFNFKKKRFGLSGLAPLIAVINSALISIGSALILFIYSNIIDTIVSLIGILIFVIIFLLHYRYIKVKFRFENKKIEDENLKKVPIEKVVNE